jgi:hypothetical protein
VIVHRDGDESARLTLKGQLDDKAVGGQELGRTALAYAARDLQGLRRQFVRAGEGASGARCWRKSLAHPAQSSSSDQLIEALMDGLKQNLSPAVQAIVFRAARWRRS